MTPIRLGVNVDHVATLRQARPGVLGLERELDGVGLLPAARLAHRGDVVDIHAQADRGHASSFLTASATLRARRPTRAALGPSTMTRQTGSVPL